MLRHQRIGPAMNSEETNLTEEQISTKILTGGGNTLMPQHPVWPGKLSGKQIDLLASLVAQRPKRSVSWGLEDIQRSLEVVVADESTLPAKPTYAIENLDDLMAIMARGRFAAGDEAKVVFFDGRTNKKVGEIATDFAPHLMDFHPKQERWAYVRTDTGYVLKIDLYSLKVVRKVRAGLNGTSLAVSRDGRYVAAGSFVPNTVVILDAATLNPLKFMQLHGINPDGKMVEADSGMITSTPYADYFVIALEQAGQVWIMDLNAPDMPDPSQRCRSQCKGPWDERQVIQWDPEPGYSGDRLVIYDSHTLKKVKSVSMEVPAGVFSHQRARTVVVGLESVP